MGGERRMSGKEKMNMQDEYDKNDYRTSAEMTLDEQIDSTKQALASAIRLLKDDEIFSIKDSIICNNCHKGKIKVFEDRGGYSVRCDYCNTTNYCRCETKEMAIRFWNRGITRA